MQQIADALGATITEKIRFRIGGHSSAVGTGWLERPGSPTKTIVASCLSEISPF